MEHKKLTIIPYSDATEVKTLNKKFVALDRSDGNINIRIRRLPCDGETDKPTCVCEKGRVVDTIFALDDEGAEMLMHLLRERLKNR